MAGGPGAGRSWQRTHRNRFGVCFPRFVCMWFVPLCPHYSQFLKYSGAGFNRQPERQTSASLRAIVLRTANANTTRPPREAAGEGARGSPGARGMRVRGPGDSSGGALGSVPRDGKQRVRFPRGCGVGEREKKNPPSLPPTSRSACLCSVSTSAGRHCSPGGGGGDEQPEEARRGFSSDQFSPSRTWKGRFPKV